jgi:hypothetical protein
MGKFRKTLLIAPLLFTISALPVPAQHRRDNNFYNGVRHGGHGGDYGNRGGYDNRYPDRGYYNDNRGGVGPGTGALIGAGGGAVLGAIFGGGLKGTIIGGAAGAGIGAALGQANQNNRDDRYYRH